MKLNVIWLAAALGMTVPMAASANKGHGDHMASMDTDGDGKVSADEHAAGAKKMFEMMDADKDGKVTAAEMDAAHEKVTGKKATKEEMSAAEKIKTIDSNGDGILTAEEHAAGAKAMFTKMDTDGDGFLGKAEMEAGHEKMMKKPSSTTK